MSNILTKSIGTTVLSPEVPGNPGVAPTPAYCVTTSTTAPSYVTQLVQGPPLLGETEPTYSWMTVSGVPTTTTTTICYPATPGVPPTPSAPANVVYQYNLGWGAGARSIASMAASGTASFSVASGVIGAVVGLDSGAVEFSYAGAEHALYFRNGLVAVLEGGSLRTGFVPYATADVFRIERSGTVVRYYKGTTLLYTSSSPSYGAQYLEASLYSGGDAVLNASLAETVTAGAGGSGGAGPYVDGLPQASGGTTLRPLSASGSGTLAGDTVRTYSSASAMLRPITAAATGITAQGGDAAFAPMQALGSNRPYAAGNAAMLPLTASAEAGTAPSFALGVAQLGYIGSAGYGLTSGNTTGEAAASKMAPMNGTGSNYAYGGGAAVLTPLTSFSAPLIPLQGWAFISAPMATAQGNVYDSTGDNAANITAPMATLSVFMGSGAKITAPKPTLSASATGTNWLSADITAPMATLSADGTVSGTSQAGLTAPMATLIGYGGMVCSVTLTGRATLDAHVTSGGIMDASVRGPMATLDLFEVTADNYSRANIIAPMGEMGATMQAWVMAPMATLTAIGSATITASYEAYAVNLNHTPKRGVEPHDEMTRYTNFPFTHVVRYQNSYFGVNSTGLYLLEGTTDAGAPIAWGFKTALTDFKDQQKKTVSEAFFGGRLGPAATLGLHTSDDGTTDASYSYSTPRDASPQNYRRTFGKGLKARYYALSATGNGTLKLDNIDFTTHTLKRRI